MKYVESENAEMCNDLVVLNLTFRSISGGYAQGFLALSFLDAKGGGYIGDK